MTILLLMTALIMPWSNIQAQKKKISVGFSGGLGWWLSKGFGYIQMFPESSFPYNASLLEQIVQLKASFNLNLQYNFSSRFGLQGEMGYQGGNYDVTLSLIPTEPGVPAAQAQHSLPWSVFTIFINLVYNTQEIEKGITPYGFIGLGICSINGDEDHNANYNMKIRSTSEMGLKLGGGLIYYFSESFPVSLNLRSFLLIIGIESTDSFYTEGNIAYVPYGGSDMGGQAQNVIWAVEGGLSFRF